MTTQPCQCDGPGFCPRFQMHMGPMRHSVCKGTSGWSGEAAAKYLENLAKRDPVPKAPPAGQPGTQLKELLRTLGIPATSGCGCDDKSRQMNEWGIEGCKLHREELVEHLKKAAAKQKWTDKVVAGVRLLGEPWFNPLDPFGSLIDEALRRAALKLSAPQYISTRRLVQDTLDYLLPQLPPNLSGIVGVPRSGMIPASTLATTLHLPLLSLDGEPKRLCHGSRGHRLRFAGDPSGPLLVCDDTIYSGRAMRKVRDAAKGRNAIFAAVYARPEAARAADIIGRALPSPHLLEWNMMNNGPMAGRAHNKIYGAGIACDLDGILCHDEHSGGKPGAPHMLPRSAPVPLIITARRERYRAGTEEWLKKWGVKWGRLIMLPDDSSEDFAVYKGRHYLDSQCGFYLESSPQQAEIIARSARKPVICPIVEMVFQ